MSSDLKRPTVGAVGWHDLTVSNADEVAAFYAAVVGWTVHDVDRGEYGDYAMTAPGRDAGQAHVCWDRGARLGMPPQWLMHVVVADLDVALAACQEQGGEVVREPVRGDRGRFAVIRDPAGAVCALWRPVDEGS